MRRQSWARFISSGEMVRNRILAEFWVNLGMYYKKKMTQERIHEFISRNKIEYRVQQFEL